MDNNIQKLLIQYKEVSEVTPVNYINLEKILNLQELTEWFIIFGGSMLLKPLLNINIKITIKELKIQRVRVTNIRCMRRS